MDGISVGCGSAPPWAVLAPDLDVGAWAWVQTRVVKPACALPPRGQPAHRGGATASVGVVDFVSIFLLRDN